MEKRKTRDRFDRRARIGRNGKTVNSLPTPRALTQIYPLLAQYRVLRTSDIHEFVGGDPQALRKYLSRQALAPHFYLKVVEASKKTRVGDYNPFIFELGPGGIE